MYLERFVIALWIPELAEQNIPNLCQNENQAFKK